MKYFSSQDILKITDYLASYKDKLEDLYERKTDVGKLEMILAKTIDLTGKNDFEKSIAVKRILAEIDLVNHEKFKEIALWIIKDWGGIRGIKEDILLERVKAFYSSPNKQPAFDSISSLSKIIALNNPAEYTMYDSRVAYTMNWIILSQNAGERFFPIPEGRNTKLKDFDIKTLIHLTDPKRYKEQKNSLFIPKDETYCEFNELVCKINKALYRDKEPFYTEMLLFALADKDIIEDILSRVHLTINNKDV